MWQLSFNLLVRIIDVSSSITRHQTWGFSSESHLSTVGPRHEWTGWLPPLTKSRDWSWLREAVYLGREGKLSLKSLTFVHSFVWKCHKWTKGFSVWPLPIPAAPSSCSCFHCLPPTPWQILDLCSVDVQVWDPLSRLTSMVALIYRVD